jgi:hypothetical protein
VVAAAGLIVLTQVPGEGGHGLALTLSGTALLALGVSPVVALATDVIVGSVAPEQAGQASGLSETGTELGGALGIAVLGSIATAVYRGHLPAGAVHARTLADAVHSAAHLPDHLAAPLVDAARMAYTQGLHVAAGLGAILAVLLAALVATVLRRAGSPGGRAKPRSRRPAPAPAAAPDRGQVRPCRGGLARRTGGDDHRRDSAGRRPAGAAKGAVQNQRVACGSGECRPAGVASAAERPVSRAPTWS